MKRALLTGATGFVGANLARRLIHDGHEVHLLVRPNHASWRIDAIRDHLRLHTADLEDRDATVRAVRHIRPEWIFHLAAHGAYADQSDTVRIVQTNILGTVHLVEACLETGFEAFVNTGSSSEYGTQDHPPAETERVEPNSAYAVAKASATLYCQHIARSRGVHLPTLRLYSVYGPYEEPTRLLPTLALAALDGRLPPLVNPDIARDFVDVDDVIQAFLLAVHPPDPTAAAGDPGTIHEHPGAIYNVGTGDQTTLREAVEMVRRTQAIVAEPQWGSMPDRQWDTNVWVADPSKISNVLGWRAEISFEQGFQRLIHWLEQHPALLHHYRTATRAPS